jgi:hypothetical protein
VTELSVNFDHPLIQSADHPVADVGRSGRVSLSDVMAWQGELQFGPRLIADEAELHTLNRAGRATPVLVYLNRGSTYEAYLCLRDDPWRSEWFVPLLSRGAGSIRFREIVGN